MHPEDTWADAVFPPINRNLTIHCGVENNHCELRVAAQLAARIFWVQEGGLLRAEGMVLAGGKASYGGAVVIEEGGRAEFDHVKFIGNNFTTSNKVPLRRPPPCPSKRCPAAHSYVCNREVSGNQEVSDD